MTDSAAPPFYIATYDLCRHVGRATFCATIAHTNAMTAIALDVPTGEEWGEELLHSFYDAAQGKKRRLRPDEKWADPAATPGFLLGLEYLGERPYVEASVPDCLDGCLDAYDGVVAGDALDELADDLRDSAPEEQRFDVETGPVAVCEFASESGYAVELRD